MDNPDMEKPYVEMRGISRSFNGFAAVSNVSFGVRRGSLAALLGPSGSGKTTLLRILAGLEQPDTGEIYIDGQLMNGVEASKRGIGFVFQSYALFRYMTVFDNIAFGLQVQKRPAAEIRQRVGELLTLTGLEGLERRFPHQLSGGQRQRVAFARALAPSPRLLLLDEPFAAIDAKLRQELRERLRQLIAQVGVTSIFVTHDQEEALAVADSIIITHQGRVEQVGSPRQLYCQPETSFAARFLGQSAEISDVSLLSGFGGRAELHGKSGLVRPESVLLLEDEADAADRGRAGDLARVESVSFRGGYYQLTLSLAAGRLLARRPAALTPLVVGQTVRVAVTELLVVEGEHCRRVSAE